MKRLLHFLAAAAACSAIAGAAAAQSPVPASAAAGCRLRIDTGVSNWIIRGYDPFASGTPTGTFDLLFVNEGQAPCTFFPTFILDQEVFGLQTNGGQLAPYRLIDLFADADVTPAAGRSLHRSTQRSVVVAPGSQQIVRYQLIVGEEAVTGDGLYSQHVEVEAQGTDGTPIGERQLVLGIDVLPSASLGLSGAFQLNHGQALVDLGELREGIAEVPLQLRVESTRRYTLTVDSRNDGHLRLENGDWSIPYQLLVNGQVMELGSGRGLYRDTAPSGPRRDSLPLAFRIGDISDRRAGTYGDVLSISIAPQ
jgi:opacity protein-like surface antigen